MQPPTGAVATPDPSLFNEQDADTIVAAVELIHGKKVIVLDAINNPGKIILYKDFDGSIKRAINFVPITREDLAKEVAKAEQELKEWQDALTLFDQMSATPAQ